MENKKLIFSQSLESCTSALYQVARRLTRNDADAEDLVAEAVTKAWVAFDSLEDKSVFKPWVLRILHNCFVSQYRKQAVRPTETSYSHTENGLDGDELISLLLSQTDEFLLWWAEPETEFTNKLLNKDIYEAIDELPEAYRVTVMLVSVEGLSYDEAAEVLKVPPGTVRSRMKRGRTLLQKRLWEHAKDANLISKHRMTEFPS